MVDVDQDLAGLVSILTLGVGLTALFLGFDWFWMVFVLGWAVLTPLAGMLAGDDAEEDAEVAVDSTSTTATTDDGDASTKDALETLRDRYARGELTEEQFERKVERLLETETVEDARDRVAGASADRERETEDARESERDR